MFALQLVNQLAEARGSGYVDTVDFSWTVALYVLSAVALWPVFSKAGLAGWVALIPILNAYVLVKIAGYHGAVFFLYLIPVVNLVVSIFVSLRVGRGFGKRGAYSFFLLWLMAPIGYFIIGYGRSKFIGTGGRPGVQPA